MSVDTHAPRSRRALLTAGVAGVAAIVAHLVGRPEEALAGGPGDDGDVLHVGQEIYDARTMLYIANNTNANYVIAGQSTAGGIAISGVSNTADGVQGSSGGNGVHGLGTGNFGIGVKGEGNNVGVLARGNGNATGLIGHSDSGIGVSAQSSGTALVVHGGASFEQSGIATVAVGSKSVQVVPGFDLTSGSRIFCTLDTNQPTLSIRNIKKNYQSGAFDNFRINLTANVASGKYAKVAWIIFED